jgi:hypothetical protein
MKKKANIKKENKVSCETKMGTNCGGCSYILGFIGAAVYYISTSTSFWIGVLGLLKAAVWPVFLVLELLKFIGA